MFKILAKNKISNRLAMAVAIPMAALIFFSGQVVYDKYSTVVRMEKLQTLTVLAPLASALIHELQKERGITSGYLGSYGGEFATEIGEQYKITDKVRSDLRRALEKFNFGQFSASLTTKVEQAQNSWKRLKGLRENVTLFNISVPEIFEYYSGTIGKILTAVGELGTINVDPRTAKLTQAYIAFLEGKELNGIERALGSLGFGSGKFEPEIHHELLQIIGKQKQFVENFRQLTTPEQFSFYLSTMDDAAVVKANQMRKIAVDTSYSNSYVTVPVTDWYNTMTRKINLLKSVEDRLAEDAIAMAKQIREEARTGYWVTLGVTGILLLLTVGCLLLILQSILRPLSEAKQIMLGLARGDTDAEITGTGREDEFGEIFDALRIFKESAGKLKSSEDQKSAILAGALDAIITTDEEGEVLEFNASAEELFKYRSTEATGKNITDLIFPLETRENRRRDWRIMRSEDPALTFGQRYELPACDASGSSFPIEISVSHYEEFDFYTAFIRDISDRKKAEEKTLLAQTELERRVEGRTLELAKAKMAAETANKAKSQFLSSMSHELRTPMNAILGFGQFLAQNPSEPLSESQKESVSHILKGGEHLMNLINEVLELSKIEAGKESVSLEDISLFEILEECVDIGGQVAEKYDVEIVTRFASDEETMIRADYTRFKQVILNLISNAAKYNRPNGKIYIRTGDGEPGYRRVEIADTGFGIPVEKRNQLFEPFDRLGAESSEIEGTGIGLTITKKLIELMSGRIDFETESGIGSTFWIEIPVIEDEKEHHLGASGGFHVDEESGLHTALEGEKPDVIKTLLYVEDNPANMELMKKIVSQIDNVEFLAAETAELGLAMASQNRPDLIFMDINLPGMSGIEALGEIREVADLKTVPVVALSARAMLDDVKRGDIAGFDRYLTKPMMIKDIVETITEYLDA